MCGCGCVCVCERSVAQESGAARTPGETQRSNQTRPRLTLTSSRRARQGVRDMWWLHPFPPLLSLRLSLCALPLFRQTAASARLDSPQCPPLCAVSVCNSLACPCSQRFSFFFSPLSPFTPFPPSFLLLPLRVDLRRVPAVAPGSYLRMLSYSACSSCGVVFLSTSEASALRSSTDVVSTSWMRSSRPLSGTGASPAAAGVALMTRARRGRGRGQRREGKDAGKRKKERKWREADQAEKKN